MCRQTSPELELFATVIHTTGAGVNGLGLIFNLRRLPENLSDVAVHSIAFIYHLHSAIAHYKRMKAGTVHG